MIIHYQCPNCAGNMSFDADSSTLSCPSCGFDENIEQHPEELIQAEFEEGDAREYHCENCSAVLLTDEHTVATSCDFCGSNVVIANRVGGTLAPSKVIPFKVTKEEAIAAFKKWTRNGLLTPRGFASRERLQSIQGVYVPSIDNHVKKRIIKNLDKAPYPVNPIVPSTEIVQDRIFCVLSRVDRV